jgi:hypothetical protein
MTREEHLRFCKICKNQGFDSKFGIICSLTGRRADFDLECDHFVEDSGWHDRLSKTKVVNLKK